MLLYGSQKQQREKHLNHLLLFFKQKKSDFATPASRPRRLARLEELSGSNRFFFSIWGGTSWWNRFVFPKNIFGNNPPTKRDLYKSWFFISQMFGGLMFNSQIYNLQLGFKHGGKETPFPHFSAG